MINAWRPALLAVIAAVALALAGCTQPSAHPTGGHPSPTRTPSPTPTQSAIPQSGLPLGCADLEKPAFVAAHYRGDTIAVAVDENSTARGFGYRAYQQRGGLRCVWGGSGRTDGGYDLGIEFEVLTDATAQYTARTSGSGSTVAWVADRVGDHSKTFCYVSDQLVQCYGDVLVGSTWLDFRLTDDNHAMSVDQAYAWSDEQLAPAILAIKGAGAPRARWVPPASAFDTRKLCDPAVASAIAGGAVTVTMNEPGGGNDPTDVGINGTATAACAWASAVQDSNVDITGLTGGAWVLAGMSANPAEAPGILGGAAQPVPIAGAGGAFVSDGELAWGAVISGGSLVEIFRDSSYTGKDNVPLMTRIVAYISAHS